MNDTVNGFTLIVIPDPDEPEAGEVYVDGAVDGHAYRFLLDTGAARTSLVFDEYTSTLNSVGSRSSSGAFARMSDDLIVIPSINVGPISREHITVSRAAAGAKHVRNLIGMDLLKDLRCHFRFDENRVLVLADDEPRDGDVFHDLFPDSGFHPYVDVLLGGTPAKAVWDTGASITVVDLNFIDKHPAFFQPAGSSAGTDASGSTMQTPMFVMSETVIGTQVFAPRRVAGVDLSQVNATIEMPMNLILGYNTLSQANWLFDFPRRRFAITGSAGAS